MRKGEGAGKEGEKGEGEEEGGAIEKERVREKVSRWADR